MPESLIWKVRGMHGWKHKWKLVSLSSDQNDLIISAIIMVINCNHVIIMILTILIKLI